MFTPVKDEIINSEREINMKSKVLIFVILILLSCFSIAAADDMSDSVLIEQNEGIITNPYYAELVDSGEMDDLLYDEQPLLESDASLDEAIVSEDQYHDKLLNEIKNFKPVIKIVFYSSETSLASKFLQDQFKNVMTHTGIPNEGDYLYFNYVQAKWSYKKYQRKAPSGELVPYHYKGGSYKYRYEITYNMAFLQSMAQEIEVSNKINAAAASLKPKDNTDGAKIRAVYDFVLKQLSPLDNKNFIKKYSYSTHAAMIGKQALSNGYATLIYRLLLTMGVDNRISGNSANRWNIVNAGGNNFILDAAADDASGTGRYYLIGEDTLASLDKAGEHVPLEAIKARLAEVTVSFDDYDGTETKVITIETPEPGVEPASEQLGIWMYNGKTGEYEEVTGKKVPLDIAGDQHIKFEVWDSNGPVPVQWKSASVKVAAITNDGIVSPLKTGNSKISATVPGVKKPLTVTVNVVAMVQPEKMWVSGPDSVAVGKTVKMVFGFNQNPQPKNKKVEWISTDPGVAEVKNGTVKGLNTGYTTIRVCSVENETVCAAADIRVYPVVTKVKINDLDDETLTIDIGTTGTSSEKLYYELGAETETTDEKGKVSSDSSQSVTWKSSSAKVASVDHNGAVRGWKAGTVTITATAVDGSKKADKIKIKVISDAQPHSLKITVGNIKDASKVIGNIKYTVPNGNITLKAEFTQQVQPTNKKVVWISSNPNVIIVSASGVVKPNISWIVANGGFTGKVSVIVSPKDHPYDPVTHENSAYAFSYPIDVDLHERKSSPFLADDRVMESNSYSFDDLEISVSDALTLDTILVDGKGKDNRNDLKISSLTEDRIDAKAAIPEVPVEIASSDNEADADKESSSTDAEPHFASDDLTLTVGESLVLDVINPDEKAIVVGISGDTDAVLWNEELNMLTSIGEAEVTAYLSTVDPVEVKDMMPIHIVAAAASGDPVTDNSTASEPVSADNEAASDEFAGEKAAEEADPDEDEIPAAGTDEIVYEEIIPDEGGSAENEVFGTAEADVDSSEAAGDYDEESVQTNEITAAESSEESAETSDETPELVITDLADEGLCGEAGSVLKVERFRFEVSDDVLSGLVFGIDDESVAKLSDISPEDMLLQGIEIDLLAAGETDLVIKRDGVDEALLKIRIVVTPAAEQEPIGDDSPAADEDGQTMDAAADSTAEEPAVEELAETADEFSVISDQTDIIPESIISETE